MKIEPFRLERYFAQHEFSAPYLLCSSDCESMTLGELVALEPGAEARLSSLWLGYTESQGAPALREAIARSYDRLDASQILVHAGAEEAIFSFMNVTLDPGDQVIVHAPYYQSLGAVAQAAGAEVVEWRGDPARHWALDLDVLKGLITQRTKAVVVNFPHNPTGFMPTADFVHELGDLSRKHGFVIFADEVYRGLELDPADRLPAMAEIDDRAVSLGVMSKAHGLAGLRIGWIATQDADRFAQMACFKDYTTICSSGPSELLATIGLDHAETIIARNRDIVRRNLDLLDAFFAAHSGRFDWYRPKAGSIAFPTLLAGEAESLCADLVEQKGVLLLPGAVYGEGYNAVRIGFGRKNLPEALERFGEFLVASVPA